MNIKASHIRRIVGINWFVPFNLISEISIPLLLDVLLPAKTSLQRAWEVISKLNPLNELANLEKGSFEIYYLNCCSIVNYVLLGKAKWDFQEGHVKSSLYMTIVHDIASEEMKLMQSLENLMTRYPNQIGNPCHLLVGHLLEMWPGVNFDQDILVPQMKSLKFLLEKYSVEKFTDYREIHGISSDKFSF